MSLAAQMGTLLSLFRNPYNGLQHLPETKPVEELVKEFDVNSIEEMNDNLLIDKILDLTVGLQFKLVILDHDWEKGQLNLTAAENYRHAVGLSSEINLMYWYLWQLGAKYLPIFQDFKGFRDGLRKQMGNIMESTNFCDPKLFKGYQPKMLEPTLGLPVLEHMRAHIFPPATVYTLFDFTYGLILPPTMTHERYVEWATPATPKITFEPIHRVRWFNKCLSEIVEDYCSGPRGEVANYYLIVSLLYLISLSVRTDDFFAIGYTDLCSREEYFAKHPNHSNAQFAKYRDTNIINSASTDITAFNSIT